MMTDFTDLLAADSVVAGMAATNKKAVLQHVAVIASRATGGDAGAIAESLAEREKLGTTGFGGGVAIPHARLEGLERMVGVFARLSQPVEFKAIDQLPVDIVFMLLSPAAAGAEHLKALARISRRLRERGFVAKLRGAGSADALYALLGGVEARDAA